ncbi:MAG: hypothetical protein ACE5DR_02400 [Thermodesulfobacteriota bacterium]
MECPYLKGISTHRLCRASPALYTPVMDDLNDYCQRDDFTDCPRFLAHTLRWTYKKGTAISAI